MNLPGRGSEYIQQAMVLPKRTEEQRDCASEGRSDLRSVLDTMLRACVLLSEMGSTGGFF